LAGGKAVKEAGGELVARAGGIDRNDASDGDDGLFLAAHHDHVMARPGADDQARILRGLFQRGRQVGLVQRGPFVFVADHVVERL
jgi:hypothetical protein